MNSALSVVKPGHDSLYPHLFQNCIN